VIEMGLDLVKAAEQPKEKEPASTLLKLIRKQGCVSHSQARVENINNVVVG
jgi:hypothetical protein